MQLTDSCYTRPDLADDGHNSASGSTTSVSPRPTHAHSCPQCHTYFSQKAPRCARSSDGSSHAQLVTFTTALPAPKCPPTRLPSATCCGRRRCVPRPSLHNALHSRRHGRFRRVPTHIRTPMHDQGRHYHLLPIKPEASPCSRLRTSGPASAHLTTPSRLSAHLCLSRAFNGLPMRCHH